MSDTPRTDAVDAVADENYGTDLYRDMLEHARALERELSEAKEGMESYRTTANNLAVRAAKAEATLESRASSTPESGDGWTWCKDGMPKDGQECLIWHCLGDTARHPHEIDVATWLNGEWIFPWDRPKLNNPPQLVRAWRPLKIAPPQPSSYATGDA